MSAETNPALWNVDTEDHEDCRACAEHEEWMCAYHCGFVDGGAYFGAVIQLVLDDPERVNVRRGEIA